MPTYKVNDPDSGMTLRVTGDSPPNERELKAIFFNAKKGKETEPSVLK